MIFFNYYIKIDDVGIRPKNIKNHNNEKFILIIKNLPYSAYRSISQSMPEEHN
jgi:hypothetical protein